MYLCLRIFLKVLNTFLHRQRALWMCLKIFFSRKGPWKMTSKSFWALAYNSALTPSFLYGSPLLSSSLADLAGTSAHLPPSQRFSAHLSVSHSPLPAFSAIYPRSLPLGSSENRREGRWSSAEKAGDALRCAVIGAMWYTLNRRELGMSLKVIFKGLF